MPFQTLPAKPLEQEECRLYTQVKQSTICICWCQFACKSVYSQAIIPHWPFLQPAPPSTPPLHPSPPVVRSPMNFQLWSICTTTRPRPTHRTHHPWLTITYWKTTCFFVAVCGNLDFFELLVNKSTSMHHKFPPHCEDWMENVKNTQAPGQNIFCTHCFIFSGPSGSNHARFSNSICPYVCIKSW